MSKVINISIDDELEIDFMNTVIKAKHSQSKVVRDALKYYCQNYEKIKERKL